MLVETGIYIYLTQKIVDVIKNLRRFCAMVLMAFKPLLVRGGQRSCL